MAGPRGDYRYNQVYCSTVLTDSGAWIEKGHLHNSGVPATCFTSYALLNWLLNGVKRVRFTALLIVALPFATEVAVFAASALSTAGQGERIGRGRRAASQNRERQAPKADGYHGGTGGSGGRQRGPGELLARNLRQYGFGQVLAKREPAVGYLMVV